jgi:hypothetical protein
MKINLNDPTWRGDFVIVEFCAGRDHLQGHIPVGREPA